jgi:hypothetical protein
VQVHSSEKKLLRALNELLTLNPKLLSPLKLPSPLNELLTLSALNELLTLNPKP